MSGIETRDRADVQDHDDLPIDPRIAARWISVRHDESRRRRRWALGALAGVTAVVGIWILAHSYVLAVHHVVVRGTRHTPRSAVVAAAGVAGHPMLDVDPQALKRRVGALPWVGDVLVHRSWPATVTIDVVERAPAGQVPGTAGEPAVVDATGRVLAAGAEAAQVLAGAKPALAVLEGVPGAGAPGSTLASGAQGALRVLAALERGPSQPRPTAAAFTVTSVTRGGDGAVSASLSPGPVHALFGTTDDLDAKVVALQSVLALQSPSQPATAPLASGATVDVRVPDAPVLSNGVLTDGKKSSSVSTTQRG